ncbi:hypothetical protein [Kibdelosporangium phytohabitans]|uniref:Septum formation initiator n=1 Tax=Kibdelosporangium phytohabitans TaxID=860235 RepID=A0A0N7F501_9PSEU|nr:hypothetical protein [Kibdelosporangium phytohabitans]ALG12855.1 hypothetical protein AOZ06_43745 [Kibdelosporangium phytohabitans]MBE1464552.1 type II secretory pathway pseudopilin PulG [Kibdelosporangium phytohabitans]
MTAPARVGGSSSRGRSSQSRRKANAEAEATAAAPETTEAPGRTQRRPRTAAAERAYARRAQREGRAGGEPVQRRPRPSKQKHERGPASRASFVMLVMGLLATGVVTTLWLSTQAIADSYRLDQAKKAATELAEQVELLQRDVTNLESPATLDEMARNLGAIRSGDPAWLVVGPDGKVNVVGEPKPAAPPAPPAPSSSVTPPPASATPGGNG